MDYIIVGGGASALSCAITLKREALRKSLDIRVRILEKNSSVGKKILATGNGRCNLTNMYMNKCFFNADASLAALILDSFSTDDCISFFDSIGLKTASEEGRVYPLTFNALSVLTLLIEECENLGVELITDTTVDSISKKDRFEISAHRTGADNNDSEKQTFLADVCILALGGKAAKIHGTDGDGYRILKALGIRYNPIHPALVQIKTEGTKTKPLHGVRVQGTIAIDGCGTETGEILFTDYGVSGIAAMQLSGNVAEALSSEKKPIIHIDLCPTMSKEEIVEYIKSRLKSNKGLSIGEALLGIINPKLSRVLVEGQEALELATAIENTATQIKDFSLVAKDTNGYKNAQVTRGGVPSSELLEGSLMAKAVDNLFITGELLDVDGMCGGYNLHFAWGSGIFAAKEAVKLASN